MQIKATLLVMCKRETISVIYRDKEEVCSEKVQKVFSVNKCKVDI